MSINTKDLSILLDSYLKNALAVGLESDNFIDRQDVTYTAAEDLFRDLIKFHNTTY